MPAFGLRWWRVSAVDDEGQPAEVSLRGLYVREPWNLDGATTALHSDKAIYVSKDASDQPHRSPFLGCGACGLYAYWPDRVGQQYGYLVLTGGDVVLGSVIGWGKVLVHNDGFRAEHARPLAFVKSDDEQTQALLEVVAQRLHAPILSGQRGLEMYGAEFGQRYTKG